MRLNNCEYSAAAEFQQRNLRRASIPDGQNNCSQTAINVNLRTSKPAEAFEQAFAGTAQGVALASDRDLAAMSVTAEYKVNRCPSSATQHNRVVCEQELHFLFARAGKRE